MATSIIHTRQISISTYLWIGSFARESPSEATRNHWQQVDHLQHSPLGHRLDERWHHRAGRWIVQLREILKVTVLERPACHCGHVLEIQHELLEQPAILLCAIDHYARLAIQLARYSRRLLGFHFLVH